MLGYILIFIGLCLILWQPWLLIVAVIVVIMYLLANKPNSFTAAIDTPPRKYKNRKDFLTYEERTEREMSNIKFKEGYQNDPRWQAKARSVGIQVEKAQEIEEARMRELGQSIKNMG